MGQSDCIEILTKEDDWLTTKEVAEKLGQSPGLVNRSLRKLYDTGFITRRNAYHPKSSTKYEWRIL